jgi:integrase
MPEKDKQKKKRRSRRYFGSVYRRKGREGWYVRFTYHERRVSRFGGSTKRDAENYLAYVQLRVKAGLPPDEEEPEEVRFPDFLKDYLKKIKAEHAASTYENEEPRLKNKIEPYFKDYLLSEIGVEVIEEFLTELAEEGSKPGTRNRYLAILSGMFRRAVKYGYLKRNPCAEIKTLPTEEKKVPYLTPTDKSQLIAALPERLRDLALIAMLTGGRRGVLLRLSWQDVDFDRNVVVLRRTKNNSVREIPMTKALAARLREKLDALEEDPEPTDRVLAELPVTWNGRLGQQFRDAAKKAGFPGLTPHDLRHVFGSTLAQLGVPITDIQKLMGHKTIRMTQRYARHSPEDAGERAIAKMEEE